MKNIGGKMANAKAGTCLVDGLTLQNAADILCLAENVHDEVLLRLVPIQLVSLRQVIEALVCYEQILTTQSHTETWLGNPELQRALNDGIICFPEIPSEIRNQLEIYSGQKMIKLATSAIFQHFVDSLTEESIEGIVLEIARHYHGLDSQVFSYFLRHDTIAHINAICAQASYKWFEEGKSAISHAAAIFGTGAFYYRALAAFLQVPYSPFCLRTPFCVYDDTFYGPSPLAGAKLAMRIIRNEAITALQSAIGPGNLRVLELDLPPILAFVLKRAKDRSDILKCALRVRETDEARNFRRDISRLTAALNKGDIPDAVRYIDLIKARAKEIFHIVGVKQEIKIKIGFGFAGLEAGLPIEMPGFLRKLLHRAERTTFYHLLLAELPTIWQLNNEVRRLFGLSLDPAIYDNEEIWFRSVSPT